LTVVVVVVDDDDDNNVDDDDVLITELFNLTSRPESHYRQERRV
jgi:hypothetical protein